MANKITNWLRTKLRSFLYIDSIEDRVALSEEDIKHLRKDVDSEKIRLNQVKTSERVNSEHFYNRFDQNEKAIKSLHTTVESVVNVGVDVKHPKQNKHSWAVICVEGKLNFVKFVKLNGRDARDVIHFLRRFDGANHCIDYPCQELFTDALFLPYFKKEE